MVELNREEITGKARIQIKLIDFGFATKLSQSASLTYQLGSPQYMAPELAQKQAYDRKVDVFAIGVIAFQLMTGKRPF